MALPKLKGVRVLKKNRSNGLRTIRRSSKGGYVKSNVVGNLIRSDAKVQNIDSYMSYASTDSVPYLVSTRSRYEAFMSGHNAKIGDVLNSYKTPHYSPFVKMAEQIRKKEETEILSIFKEVWPELSSANDVISKLNLLEVEIRGAKVKISEIVGTAAKDVQTAFFRFRDSNEYGRAQFYQFLETAGYDPEAFTQLKHGSIVQAREPYIKYRKHSENVANGLINAIDIFTLAFNFIELKEGTKASIFTEPLSAMSVPLAGSNMQVKQGKGVGDAEFVRLMTKINEITEKINTTLGDATDRVGISKKWFNSGQYAEVLMVGLLGMAVSQAMETDSVDGSGIKKEIDRNAGKVAFSLVSDKPSEFNTIDFIMTYGNNSIGFDMKTHSDAKFKLYDGLVYESTMSVDFKAAQESLFENRQSSLPPSALKMYRAYLLNKSVNEGYTLNTNKERGMYVMEYLKSKDGLDYKFDSPEMGYPSIVSINGKFFRFSDVIARMKNFDDFFAQFSSSGGKVSSTARVLGRQKLSSYGFEPQELYMAKIMAGSDNGKTHSKRTRGFVKKVPGLDKMITAIESDYFNVQPKKSVDFKIMLRV